jgi:hypothetical protein
LDVQGSQQVQAAQQLQETLRSRNEWQSSRSSGSAMQQRQPRQPPQRRMLCLRAHQLTLLLRWLVRLLAWQKQTMPGHLLGV